MPKKKGVVRSEEERLLQLQHRAQAEEELAKKKEETLTLFLKDKLQKEQRNSTVNQLKLNDGWRTILRRTRDSELRRDVGVLRQTFERQLDDLDGIIQMLVGDLQEAERQAAQAQRHHLQHVERLWAEQQRRLQSLRQQWDDDLHNIGGILLSESNQQQVQVEQQSIKFQDLTLTVDQRNQDAIRDVRDLYEDTLRFYTSSHEDRKSLKDDMKQRTVVLKSVKALQQSVAKLESQENQEQLNAKGSQNVKRLQGVVAQQQKRLDSWESPSDLKDARDHVTKKCHELRDQLIRARAAARKQLTRLNVQSAAATKTLQDAISKGEKVLRAAELCIKLENKQGNISSSSSSSSADKQQRDKNTQVFEWAELQPLMQRINTAILQREALKKRCDDLSRENKQLRLLLQRHNDTLDGHGAPLTASSAPTTSVPAAADRRHTVIEAAHAIKHSL